MRVLGLFVASLNAQSICQTNCEDENLRCLSRCTIGDSACIRVCVDDEDKCMAKCSSKSFALLQGTKTPKILNFDLGNYNINKISVCWNIFHIKRVNDLNS
jgi:hypothetical protein